PSDWLLRHAHLLAPGMAALDLACGSGRHVRWLAERGLQVTGVDRDAAALAGLTGLAGVTPVVADLEASPWPEDSLRPGHFDLVLVTNYLWRPNWPRLAGLLAPGGWLIYETFALGQETVGRPSRPDFLLAPGELLHLAAASTPPLAVLAYEDGWLAAGDINQPPRRIQRLVAWREAALPDDQDGNAQASQPVWPQDRRLPQNLRPG
ncbi:MAG: hypothetical protein RL722_1194, partial [Pseudomonadota bacterium]